MTYLLLGEDSLAKDQKITALKEEILCSSCSAAAFDYETLDAGGIDARALQKTFSALPVVNGKRLIVLRSIQKLDTSSKEVLLQFVSQKHDDIVVILEAGNIEGSNAFIKDISAHSKVIQLQTQKRQNVFDVTNALSARDPAKACAVLNNLFEQGNHPLQIMGGLIWFWGKSKNVMSEENFQKGLLTLQEADLNIKRSKLKPEYGLELLIIKLAALYSN